MIRICTYFLIWISLLLGTQAANAVDLGRIIRPLYREYESFAASQYQLPKYVAPGIVATAFFSLAVQDLLTPQQPLTQHAHADWSGFFWNLHSGMGWKKMQGESLSNAHVYRLGSTRPFSARLDVESGGSYSGSGAQSMFAASVGYQQFFGRLMVGLIADWALNATSHEFDRGYSIFPRSTNQALSYHRFATNVSSIGVAAVRLGWMFDERLMAYIQAGPALASARIGAGMSDPAADLWSQRNRTLFGRSAAIGLSYRTASLWTLGIEASVVRFNPIRIANVDSSGQYFSQTSMRITHPALKLSVGRQF